MRDLASPDVATAAHMARDEDPGDPFDGPSRSELALDEREYHEWRGAWQARHTVRDREGWSYSVRCGEPDCLCAGNADYLLRRASGREAA